MRPRSPLHKVRRMADDPIDHTLGGIQRALGELRGDVKAILRAMEQERSDAKESRRVIYERIERVEESVHIAAQVAAQARDRSAANTKILETEVLPQTGRIKAMGIKGGGFLAGAALVGGLASQPAVAAVVTFFEKFTKG